MEIRKAKISDVDELCRLEKKFIKELDLHVIPRLRITSYDEELLKKEFRKKIRNKKGFFLVLDLGSSLRGYFFGKIMVSKMEKYGYNHNNIQYGYLENIFLEKFLRKKGYFFQMHNQFMQFLKEKDIKYCRLHVDAKNSAYKVYEKMGFHDEEIRMFKKI